MSILIASEMTKKDIIHNVLMMNELQAPQSKLKKLIKDSRKYLIEYVVFFSYCESVL